MAKSATPVLDGYPVNEIAYGDRAGAYEKLHVVRLDEGGDFLARFELTEGERERVARTGQVFVIIHTRGKHMQPVTLRCDAPTVEDGEAVWPEGAK